jgi:hypothetical protein
MDSSKSHILPGGNSSPRSNSVISRSSRTKSQYWQHHHRRLVDKKGQDLSSTFRRCTRHLPAYKMEDESRGQVLGGICRLPRHLGQSHEYSSCFDFTRVAAMLVAQFRGCMGFYVTRLGTCPMCSGSKGKEHAGHEILSLWWAFLYRCFEIREPRLRFA